MPGRVALLLLSVLLISCGGSGTVAIASPSPSHAPSPSISPSPAVTPSPAQQLGPGGLTLDQEVGAVMMVGIQGSLTSAALADLTRHQFGGLLIVNGNQNATTAASMKAFIAKVRGVMQHRLIAATDQEGGQVCLAISSVPCDADAGRAIGLDPDGVGAEVSGL